MVDAARSVTLTFDNGPTPGVTDRVLDLLAERDAHAMFFVVGRQLERPGGRDLVERAVAEGHVVGNHSLTHTTALGELDDDDAVDREIDGCEALLAGIDRSERLFRPFGNGGAIDHRLLSGHAVDRLLDGGFTCALWTSVPHDWDDPDGWVDRAMEDVTAVDHAVVVVHDVRGAALPRLPELLDRLDAAGAGLTVDLPESCVPIRRGRPTESFHLVSQTKEPA